MTDKNTSVTLRNLHSSFGLPSSMRRRNPASQPRTPAIKSSIGVLSPRLFLEMSTSKGIFCCHVEHCVDEPAKPVESTADHSLRHSPLSLFRGPTASRTTQIAISLATLQALSCAATPWSTFCSMHKPKAEPDGCCREGVGRIWGPAELIRWPFRPGLSERPPEESRVAWKAFGVIFLRTCQSPQRAQLIL